MSIKLVAIDLDDTLLNAELKISPLAIKTLNKVKDRGIRITLATGRMFRSARPYALELGMDIALITYQGALVKNAVSNEILYHRAVPSLQAGKVVEIVRRAGYHYQAYFDDNLYMEKLTPEGQAYAELAGVKPCIEADLAAKIEDKLATKIIIIHNNLPRLQQMEAHLQSLFADELYITRSKPNYLEVLNKEATKGLGLQAVADYYHFNRSEIMAIGDSYNDIEMLKYAGTAVVVENAPPEVKSYADYITAGNEEDGVAQALERLVLAKN